MNGQSKSEFLKNYTRVKDIVTKSEGNMDKSITLARTQANRIMDEYKAINRAMAAKQLSKEYKKMNDIDSSDICLEIFDIFFRRAYELGSVSKQDYREYQLSKLNL